MKNFKNILFLLSFEERRRFIWLLLMMLLMSFVETLGVASIFPFIAILTNPIMIETNIFLSKIFQVSKVFGVKDNQHFFLLLGSCVFLILIISIIIKIFTSFLQVRFVKMLEYSIGKRLMESYLNQPYSWFLSHNSNELVKNILSEVTHIIENAIYPFAEMIAKGMVAISLLGLLVYTDIKLALLISFFIGGIYALIYYFLKNFISRIGKERLKNNHLRYRVVSQTFGSIKNVKVRGSEKINLQLFSNSASNFARSETYAHLTGSLPRFILEGIAFAGIMLILLYLIAQKGTMISALPIISLYVFAGYRLMPSIQQVYSSFTNLRYTSSSLDRLTNEIKNLKSYVLNQDKSILTLDKEIALHNIHYNYPDTPSSTLKDINLSIPAKSIIGFVGPSGSGKTTTVDIILGLLEPQKGTLEVDGKVITKYNSRAWQRSIGYVPQHIYLLDDTIFNNIAFGIDHKEINQNWIEKACKIACLEEFIDELPKKHHTIIGEGGIRLSGGQRQRIGIARALYHNPRVLILDEATSALDNETEQTVMNAINNLGKDITIILIAHRLNTVKNCDTIFKLERGKLVFQGNFNELINYDKKSS
ncbi:ABC transporter ATP-binding protein/permease [Candidatus Pelagibacter ubique]|nr:ABC transporter ATP-binding protein/permease [Candidatus Pelagibacter ubique]